MHCSPLYFQGLTVLRSHTPPSIRQSTRSNSPVSVRETAGELGNFHPALTGRTTERFQTCLSALYCPPEGLHIALIAKKRILRADEGRIHRLATQEARSTSYCRLLPPQPIATLLEGDGNRTQAQLSLSD
jgi:hypothetical protein